MSGPEGREWHGGARENMHKSEKRPDGSLFPSGLFSDLYRAQPDMSGLEDREWAWRGERKQNDHRGSEANEELATFRMVFLDWNFAWRFRGSTWFQADVWVKKLCLTPWREILIMVTKEKMWISRKIENIQKSIEIQEKFYQDIKTP